MSGIVKNYTIFDLDIALVFRHRNDNDDNVGKLEDKYTTWRFWRLGFFYKNYLVVKGFNIDNKPSFVRSHMIGVDLLWAKAFIIIKTNKYHE